MKAKSTIFICILAASALAACTKKDITETQSGGLSGEYTYTFRLADATKAAFATDHIAWETGDKVGCYAQAASEVSLNKSTDVTVSGDDVTITVRSAKALQAGDNVWVYAPFSAANDKKTATSIQLEIPRNQVSGDAAAMPLVALPLTIDGAVPADSDTEVGTINFLNLGSVVKLNVYSTSPEYQGEEIENVSFIAGAPVAGTFSYDLTSVVEESPAAISGYSETDVVVTGRGTVGTSKDAGAEFYMVVAPGTYSGQYVVRTGRADYTFTIASAMTYSRAGIKTVNIDLASTSWVKHTGYDTSIDSPRELSEFLAGTSASDTGEYTISADLDMTGYTLPSASGFGGTLDGGEHTIYNIASQTALFQTNKGTIKNLTIAGAFTPTSQIFGALVNIDNGGTYDHVTNRATVTFAAAGDVTGGLSIGGFVGATEAGKFTSCTNEGTVLVDIAGKHESAYVAGFAGFTKEHVIIDGCTSAGNVTLRAVCGNPRAGFTILGSEMSTGGIAVGGFIGRANTTAAITTEAEAKSGAAYVNNSPVNADVTLDYSDISAISGDGSNGNVDVAGAVGYGNSYIYKVTNSGDVKAYGRSSSGAAKKEFILHVGGIFGKAYNYTCVGSCRMDGDITVVNDCTGDNANVKAGVGGMAGCGGYNGPTSSGQTDVNYSRVTGDINVSGKGKNMGIGGVIGWNGKQWNNKVDASCKIECSLTGEYAFVGGLVGGVAGGAANYTIKACSCAAEIRTTANKLRTGGLIGNWGGASASGSSACFTYRGTPSEPCSFSGSVYSTNNSQNYVGIIAGYVDGSGKTVVFGDNAADNLKIQVSGTIQKNGMSSPVAITSANFDTYKWGGNKATTTIYATVIE